MDKSTLITQFNLILNFISSFYLSFQSSPETVPNRIQVTHSSPHKHKTPSKEKGALSSCKPYIPRPGFLLRLFLHYNNWEIKALVGCRCLLFNFDRLQHNNRDFVGRVSSWWPAGWARTVNDMKRQEKKEIRNQNWTPFVHWCFPRPQDVHLLCFFESWVVFPLWNATSKLISFDVYWKSITKWENFNNAIPKLENYSWFDPFVQNLQIISVSFRSYTKKHLHWTF